MRSEVRGQRSSGGGRSLNLVRQDAAPTRKRPAYKPFRVVEIRRTWKRDGSHPEPGVLVREERFSHWTRLRVDEVKELGLIEALCREQLRQIEKVINNPKVINSPSEKVERKGK